MQDIYVIVGVGFIGVIFVCQLVEVGCKFVVFDKCFYVVGNCYMEWDVDIGIMVYKYGLYIFYIDDGEVWGFI